MLSLVVSRFSLLVSCFFFLLLLLFVVVGWFLVGCLWLLTASCFLLVVSCSCCCFLCFCWSLPPDLNASSSPPSSDWQSHWPRPMTWETAEPPQIRTFWSIGKIQMCRMYGIYIYVYHKSYMYGKCIGTYSIHGTYWEYEIYLSLE